MPPSIVGYPVQKHDRAVQCFHSYSQLWLWPYGYDYNVYPENRERAIHFIVTCIYLRTHREEIEQLAIDGADAIFGVHGKVYDPINSADLCKGHIQKKCGV